MCNTYIYKFSTDTYDYYMRQDMRMVKVLDSIPGGRSDKMIDKHCVDAEDDFAVLEFFS